MVCRGISHESLVFSQRVLDVYMPKNTSEKTEIFHGVHIPQENFTYYFIPHHRKYIDATYAQCTMGRVNVIPLNIHAQQLSCVLITPLTFSNYI